MALAVGTRLGSCEVLGPIGAGGMGEVYRARDLKLGREVALKMLPDAVARDPERRARFEREARLLASLNHPHVAAIYELLETEEGVPVLVLELVEGETLDVRIARGPLPLREALVLASQVAEALEAAHERGILHRDLKPSNVKLTRDGKAKLLDFGLAKALEDGKAEPRGGGVASSAATLTSPADATAVGAVLGTAPYMSPEQARGEPLDKRTDVWSFGCVLFELLGGRRAFAGATRAETTAAVLEREPDWGALPEGTPATVRTLLRRCLRKEKDERLRDMGDARIELREALDDMSSGVSSGVGPGAPLGAAKAARRHRWVLWTGGLLVLGVTLALGVRALWSRLASPVAPARLTLSPPGEVKLMDLGARPQHLALAPDGRRIAFLGTSPRGVAIYLQDIGEIEARVVPGTEDASIVFFSPDGRWLGFAQGTRLMKAPVEGGSPQVICDIPAGAGLPGSSMRVRGASWGPAGTIVFAPEVYSALWRVPAEGGTPEPLTTQDREKGEVSHRWPQVLPGGRAALFGIGTHSPFASHARIGVVSLETGRHHVVLEGTGFARYISTGHVLYARDGSVLAVPFDLRRLEVTGAPLAVLSDVQTGLVGHLYAAFDVSASGALAYVPGAYRLSPLLLLWVDREGQTERVTPITRPWVFPRLSPDGRRLALMVRNSPESTDVWLLDLERDTLTRLTSGGASAPVWSPDGRELAVTMVAASGTRTMTVATDGSDRTQLVAEDQSPQAGQRGLEEWSRGGQLVFTQQNPGRGLDIGVQPAAAGGPATYLLANPYIECCTALSPDGRWMAYVSNETGAYEIYVQRFPGLGEKRRVSTDGGIQPRWSRNGREIFYRGTGERPKIVAVAVETRGGIRLGRPRPLFDDVFGLDLPYVRANYDVAADGRFVFVEKSPEDPAPRQIVLIPDFARELKEKLRAAGR
jgi:Tol biopolymer transport system component